MGRHDPVPAASVVNGALAGNIAVPVVVVIDAPERPFPPSAAERQVLLYTGSPQVTLQTINETAHAVALERIRGTCRGHAQLA